LVIGVLGLIIIGNPKRGRFDDLSKKADVIEEETEEEDVSTCRKVLTFLKENALGFYDTFTNKTCLFVLLASCARMWSFLTIVYYALAFFAHFGNSSQFGILDSCAVVFGGFASNLIAGVLSDRLEARCSKIKSWLGVIMSLLGVVMNCMCFLYTDSFAFSMTFLFLTYLLTEGWISPANAMISLSINPKRKAVGLCCFLATTITAGSLAVYIQGKLITQYDITS